MRNKVAKHLRREALTEMLGDGVPKRQLVGSKRGVINSPNSVRALYLHMKIALKALKARTHEAIVQPARTRKPSGFHRPQDMRAGPALILSPLRHIQKAFPGFTAPDGSFCPSKTSVLAMQYAKSGQGEVIRFMARQVA